MLAEERKPDALDAFRVARRWFQAGRRIEMQELAAELGVNRATLFRWVGSRDDLLWGDTLVAGRADARRCARSRRGLGGRRRTAHHRSDRSLRGHARRGDFLRDFLRREPERALRILTTRAGTVQARLVGAIDALLNEEVSRGNLRSRLPLRDLAYLVVRIVESFLYAEFIIGEEPDIAMVELAVGALLGHQGPEAG